MRKSLISVIITSKNEGSYIKNLLESIKKQTYSQVEIIVVDNNSKDKTKEIAKRYTPLVFNKGPERSVQRNFGAKKAKGEYLFFLDADMELEPDVIGQCIGTIKAEKVGAIIVPEESFGKGFWTKVKAYERSFYIGDETIEAARFYDRSVFFELGGFDENMTGPEDWDFSDRVKKRFGLARIKSLIRHNEGDLSLPELMRKKYYYAGKAGVYLKKNQQSVFSPKTFFFFRRSFYQGAKKIFFHPILFCAMILMLSAELLAGAVGFLMGRKNE